MTYIPCGYEARGWIAPLVNNVPGTINAPGGFPFTLGLRSFDIPEDFDKHNISTSLTGGYKANRSGQVGGTFTIGLFADQDRWLGNPNTYNMSAASVINGQQYYLELWTKGPALAGGVQQGGNAVTVAANGQSNALYAAGGLGVYKFSAFCLTKLKTAGKVEGTVDIDCEGTSNGAFVEPTN